MRWRNKWSVVVMAALFAIGVSLSAYAQSEYWQQRVSLFELLPIGEDDIVFLGNSITDGGEFSEMFGLPGIKNRGISSDIVGGVDKRLYQVVSGHPRKIFLLIGINDVSHALSAETIAGEYERLVERIRRESPSTELYVQSVMPINNDFGRYRNLRGREKVIPQLNSLLCDIAARHGATYIDLWPALADPATGKLRREFTNDGLHLTGKGYKAWTGAIQEYVMDDSLTESSKKAK